MSEITAILNSYNRPENIQSQIDKLNNQTIKPDEIWVWCNKGERGLPKITTPNVKVISSNFNFKFHGRFALASLVKTKYIAIFDDDCFPEKKWFENCLNIITKNDCILGASGILLEGSQYMPHKKVGWNGIKNNNLTEVDLVGHAWFFKKTTLKYLWMEEPLTWDNGEDIQLSYLAKKYGNIKTFVPPHPQNNLEIWGNNEALGRKHGDDDNASYKKNKDHYKLRNYLCETYIKNGWKTINKK